MFCDKNLTYLGDTFYYKPSEFGFSIPPYPNVKDPQFSILLHNTISDPLEYISVSVENSTKWYDNSRETIYLDGSSKPNNNKLLPVAFDSITYRSKNISNEEMKKIYIGDIVEFLDSDFTYYYTAKRDIFGVEDPPDSGQYTGINLSDPLIYTITDDWEITENEDIIIDESNIIIPPLDINQSEAGIFIFNDILYIHEGMGVRNPIPSEDHSPFIIGQRDFSRTYANWWTNENLHPDTRIDPAPHPKSSGKYQYFNDEGNDLDNAVIQDFIFREMGLRGANHIDKDILCGIIQEVINDGKYYCKEWEKYDLVGDLPDRIDEHVTYSIKLSKQ